MNKHVQIRNVPPTLHTKLKKRAANEGVSLSTYLRGELERIAGRPTIRELTEKLRRRPPLAISSDQIVSAIQEARDERDRQIDEALGLDTH
jgi:antitoxin FitA